MSVRIYQYPSCSTCKKALKWLGRHDVDYQSIHIVDSPPDVAAIEDMWQRSGLPLKKLFNTAGQSYRRGNFKERLPAMTQAEALAALAADGKLIKRPLIDTGSAVLVGYEESALAERF